MSVLLFRCCHPVVSNNKHRRVFRLIQACAAVIGHEDAKRAEAKGTLSLHAASSATPFSPCPPALAGITAGLVYLLGVWLITDKGHIDDPVRPLLPLLPAHHGASCIDWYSHLHRM